MTEVIETQEAPAAATNRYGVPAILLHWTSVALIVFVGALGLCFGLIPRSSRLFWINIHAVVGLAVLILAVLRIVWRLRHGAPDYPEGTPALTRRLSGPAHWLLYALMVVLPLVGIVAYVWHARVFDFGLFKVNFGIASNKPVYEAAEEIHEFLAFSLFGLAGLHGLAALWHRFVRKDGLMERMLPWGRA